MSLFRSFRVRIAALTAVVAGIVFGLFSVLAYSSIHRELEKSVDTRIMVEARSVFGRGVVIAAGWSRMTRPRNRDEDGTRTERDASNVDLESGRSSRLPGADAPRVDAPAPVASSNETNDGTDAVAETEAIDPLQQEIQVFAGCMFEVSDTGQKEIFRSENWPADFPVLASHYGEGKAIEPTEVNDLLRGLRSRPPGDWPPGGGEGFIGPREPRRGGSGDDAGERVRPAEEAGPASGSVSEIPGPPESEANGSNGERRQGDRNGPGRGRGRGWRGGMVLTKEPHFHYETAGGERWRIGVFATDRHEVMVAASLTAFNANVHKLRSAFAIAVPSAVILIAFGAWLVSGQAIRPIRDIADTAEKVTAAGLSQRIAEPGTGDELHRLTVVLNRMLDRLEDGFKQATRFSADASHELKTPLTIMQGELEAALREAPPASPQQRVYGSQLEEVTRLKRIVSSLLLLSRADAGQLNLTRERIDVSSNFAAICEDAEILADAANISLTSEVEPGLAILGDRALLQQVFQNLISNAVKYNRPSGSIICRLSRDDAGGNAVFDFENTGDSIPEEDQEKVFRRFHRADAARGRDIDGFGLGLNLALEIARAHSGTLVLIKSNAESTHFRLTIPLAQA